MRGKSAAVILRQIHPTIYAEAQRLLMEGEVVRFVTGIKGLENALAVAMTFQREDT